MKNLRAVLWLSAVLVVTLAALGCGSGSSPLAVVGPTAHPLVAQYSIEHFHSGLTAWVEFGTDTNYGRQTSMMTASSTTPEGELLNILVAGMKPQTTYHMRAHVNWSGGSWVDQDHTFTTGAIPSSVTVPTSIKITRPNANLSPAPGVELLSLITPNTYGPVVTDLQGNIIWYYPHGAAPAKLMDNGDVITNLGGDLREVDLAGNMVRDVSVAQVNQSLQSNGYTFTVNGFSHDVLVLPNGHWLTIGGTTKDFTDLPGYPGTTTVVGDAIVDIDPTGNVAWGWSAFDYLDVNRHLQGLPDWTHSNALVYTADGNLLISMRHQSWILELNYADGLGSGNVLWKLGEGGDFTLTGGDPSQWFYGQHDPVIYSVNGSQTVMGIYDDGNFRVYSDGSICSTTSTAPACYSRATTFQIDEGTMTASMLWQDLPGYFSFWGGSIGSLSNRDIEFASSDPHGVLSSQVQEVTSSSTPQIVWQMDITGEWTYRGTRLPSLYPGVIWKQ